MTELALRNIATSPRGLMWSCLAVLTATGWTYLGTFNDVLQAICGANPPTLNFREGGLLFSMWLAMSLAMMLPAAAPTVATYLDISEAAQAKSMRIVPPIVLVAGYAVVWVLFAALATALQLAAAPWLPLFSPVLGGTVLIFAGVYQFSTIKQACLTKCRAPLPFFLSRWSDRSSGVFLMGVEQGLVCLGCCWALMMLGVLTGFMNLAWMAAIAAIAILEKTLPEPRPVVYGCGIGLLGAGMFLIVRG